MSELERGQERSVGEIVGELTQDLGLLVRQEAQLAKTEIQTKVRRATGSLASLAIGGIVAGVGALALTAATILLLVESAGLQPWLAALLVGGVLASAGSFVLQGALQSLGRIDPTPRRTLESLKELTKEHQS